jgi:hypothetical protein
LCGPDLRFSPGFHHGLGLVLASIWSDSSSTSTWPAATVSPSRTLGDAAGNLLATVMLTLDALAGSASGRSKKPDRRV